MRTYLFKHEGVVGDSRLFHARIEVWSDDGFVSYSKVFTTEFLRAKWIKDKLELLKLIPPVFEPGPLYKYKVEDTQAPEWKMAA